VGREPDRLPTVETVGYAHDTRPAYTGLEKPRHELSAGTEAMNPHDNGQLWGYIDREGVYRPLPKIPMLLANMGPPPFDVTLPSGEVRHIIDQPMGNLT